MGVYLWVSVCVLCFLELWVYKSPLVNGGGSRGGGGGGETRWVGVFKVVKSPFLFKKLLGRLLSCKLGTAPAASEQGKLCVLPCRLSVWPMYLAMRCEGHRPLKRAYLIEIRASQHEVTARTIVALRLGVSPWRLLVQQSFVLIGAFFFCLVQLTRSQK